MGMPVPVVGVDPSPTWASLLVTDLGIIDSHDHTTGNGAPLTTSSITVNANFPFAGNSITGLKALIFTSQTVPIPASGIYLDALYVSGVDLYYNDGNGNQVRVTQSGGIAGSPGSISNLTSPASASYVAGSTKFVWQSAATTSADMDFGAAIMRNNTASSFALTLQPPTLGSNYSITLPALPASQKIMTMDASGVMAAPYSLDNSTIVASANVIGVPAGGIGTTQLAALSVTNAKLAALNYTLSSSCGTFSTTSTSYGTVTNFSISLTTSGRPVSFQLVPDGSTSDANPSTAFSTGSSTMFWRVARDATVVAVGQWGTSINVPVAAMAGTDFGASAGTYTYTFQIRSSSSNNVGISYAKFFVQEL